MRSVILERLIFCVSYSMVTLPVIPSTLTFETPLNLPIACLRLSAPKSAHVQHPVQSIFEAFRITFSIVIGSPRANTCIQVFKYIVTTSDIRKPTISKKNQRIFSLRMLLISLGLAML